MGTIQQYDQPIKCKYGSTLVSLPSNKEQWLMYVEAQIGRLKDCRDDKFIEKDRFDEMADYLFQYIKMEWAQEAE